MCHADSSRVSGAGSLGSQRSLVSAVVSQVACCPAGADTHSYNRLLTCRKTFTLVSSARAEWRHSQHFRNFFCRYDSDTTWLVCTWYVFTAQVSTGPIRGRANTGGWSRAFPSDRGYRDAKTAIYDTPLNLPAPRWGCSPPRVFLAVRACGCLLLVLLLQGRGSKVETFAGAQQQQRGALGCTRWKVRRRADRVPTRRCYRAELRQCRGEREHYRSCIYQ